MRNFIFTDLAYESYEMKNEESLWTKEYCRGMSGELRVFEMRIEKEEQVARYGRPRGHYLTVLCDKIWGLEVPTLNALRETIASIVFRLIRGRLGDEDRPRTILVVGLGNDTFTVDALGPRAVEQIQATRHLLEDAEGEEAAFLLATLIPRVKADTGMEAAEQIRGVVHTIGADAVLVLDALAASHYERLGATVQISDSGICPGSGIGNTRRAITEQTVGVPVISLGVPTVVDAATLICDALQQSGTQTLTLPMKEAISRYHGLFVCPKESDLITKGAAFLLADAVQLLGGIKRGDDAYSEA